MLSIDELVESYRRQTGRIDQTKRGHMSYGPRTNSKNTAQRENRFAAIRSDAIANYHAKKATLPSTSMKTSSLPHTVRIPTNVKRGNEEINENVLYVLGPQTKKFISVFLNAINVPFYQSTYGVDVEDDIPAHEEFLFNELSVKDEHGDAGTYLDVAKIEDLLKDEENHLKVMSALAHLLDIDLSKMDALEYLQSDDEKTEFNRIWDRVLPRWYKLRNLAEYK